MSLGINCWAKKSAISTVTNVRNGVVRIVDRGLYDHGRVIDVSRACGCLYLLAGLHKV